MKKLICILLSVVLLFLLTGFAKKETVNINNIVFNSPKPLYLESWEHILIFAHSDYAPDGFIRPDDLEIIGNSEQKVAYYGSFRDFTLFFNDANGVRIHLNMVYGKSYKPYKSTYKVTDGMTSMLYIEPPKPIRGTAYIERCGVLYCYGTDNYLNQIIFYVDDIQMTMQVSCTSKNPYPEDQQETFYTKLLSLSDEVVLDAIGELEESIYARWGGKERIPSKVNWLLPAGIGVGIAALGVAGFVIWKKKKKTKTTSKADEAAVPESEEAAVPIPEEASADQ